MIEILPETTQALLALKMSGLVSEEDIDQCGAQIEQQLQDERTDTVLIDWLDLAGWVPGAKSVGTWFGMHHWATVRRVAIVADAKWEDEKMRIADIFKAAQVRRFAPADRSQAFEWVRI